MQVVVAPVHVLMHLEQEVVLEVIQVQEEKV